MVRITGEAALRWAAMKAARGDEPPKPRPVRLSAAKSALRRREAAVLNDTLLPAAEEYSQRMLEARRASGRRSRGADADSTTRPMPERCECCDRPPTAVKGGKATLVWDHNHATGKFRGWLCSKCNTALGLLDDDASLIEALAVYLNERASKHDEP